MLCKTEFCGTVIRDLNASDFCTKFPKESLDFLDSLIGNKLTYGVEYLKECLDKIGESNPQLLSNRKFVRLMDLTRKFDSGV
jgi:hypothetical protein